MAHLPTRMEADNNHSVLCAPREGLIGCMDLINITIGKEQLISFWGRAGSKWKTEWKGRVIFMRWFAFFFWNYSRRSGGWLSLETELERVTLVSLPKLAHLFPFTPLFLFGFPPFGSTSTSFVSWFHDGAEMPINRLAIRRRTSPIYISLLGRLPEHPLRHMNYYRNITAVSTFCSIQLPIIIFLADNTEILNSSILLK